MTTPITRAEQIAWQRQTAALLVKLLARAAKENLPPVNWTVGSGGSTLHGECLTLSGDRRGDFWAWRDALGTPSREHGTPIPDVGARLTAVWERMERVQVVLTAIVWDEAEGEA